MSQRQACVLGSRDSPLLWACPALLEQTLQTLSSKCSPGGRSAGHGAARRPFGGVGSGGWSWAAACAWDRAGSRHPFPLKSLEMLWDVAGEQPRGAAAGSAPRGRGDLAGNCRGARAPGGRRASGGRGRWRPRPLRGPCCRGSGAERWPGWGQGAGIWSCRKV